MKSIKRRDFLKGALAASAVGVAPFRILKAGPAPSDKLNVAVIGVGSQGSYNAHSIAKTDNVIAFCDVDDERSGKFIANLKNLQDVKRWTDYRVMFDKIGNELDAVVIATPEHAHFAAAMHAIKRGKHVYCQKPLCHTVNEVRLLTEEAGKHKNVVTQMGNQGHSTRSSALLRDWGLAGTVGEIREVHAYSRKNYWTDKPLAPASTPPKTLNWDLYLNRAEKIPFSTSYMNREWIRYSHFSGAVGDMGAHILDPAYYALDLRVPLSVHADVPIPAQPGSLPRGGIITWEFAARGKRPPVTMKYYLGVGIDFPAPQAPREGPQGHHQRLGAGGGEGVDHGRQPQPGCPADSRVVHEGHARCRPPKAFRCKGQTHFENWSLACKGQDKAMSSFDYAGPLSEIIVLGDIALLHPGKTLLWDSENMRITNDEAADKSLFMRRLHPRDEINWF